MKKRRFWIVLVVILSMLMMTTAFASGEIKVAIDGTYVEFDVKPQAINGRTMVPLRAIFEALGAEVDWDNDSQTVTAIREDVTVTASIGSVKMYVNSEEKTMDVAPIAIDGRTLVPVRFIAEAYDCKVEWDGDSNIVDIETKKPYIMRTLAEAKVDTADFATMDADDNIYYIDTDDKSIYKIDTKTGKKSRYITTQNLSHNETIIDEDSEQEIEYEYTSFVPIQVFYDNINDKLLLIGYYEEMVESFKEPRNNVEIPFIYDISSGEAKVYSKINIQPLRGTSAIFCVQTALNKKKLVLSERYGGSYILSVEDGEITRINMDFSPHWKLGAIHTPNSICISGVVYNNRLFGFNGSVVEYDFSGDNYDSITEWIDNRKAFGIKEDCYYFWDSKQIYKISVKSGKTTVLDINTNYADVEFDDMSNLNYIDYKFFVIDDNTIIFYDADMEAFRILEKN